MKLLLRIFFFLIFSTACLTQLRAQDIFQIHGVVIDGLNQRPLEGVNVMDTTNLKHGTITDKDGKFSIKIDDLPRTFRISFVGYHSQLVTIEEVQQEGIRIQLLPDEVILPEISVSAKIRIDTLFSKPYSIVDYVFIEEQIVLLVHRDAVRKYALITLDQRSHREIQELSLRSYRPKGLFQHCTGETFLITEANAYPIQFQNLKFELLSPVFLGEFYLLEQPCVEASEKFIYFAKYYYQGQALKYLAFSRLQNPANSNQFHIDSLNFYEFPLIQNEDNIVRLIEEMGMRMPWSGDIWDKNMDARLAVLKDSKYKLEGIMKIFYPVLNVPLHIVSNQLILFNHPASEIQYFSLRGEFKNKIPINYHQNKKWKKRIYFDKIQQRAFTTFDTRWGERIHEVNLQNGTLAPALEIDLPFVENIVIHDGYFYFLYRASWSGERRRKLYRIKL